MTLLDHNREFLQLAAVLAEAEGRRDAEFVQSDLQRLALDRRFDLVTCAYALTELSDGGAAAVTERLWAHCDGVLAIVEPGRPRDYQRLMVARDRLIQLGGTLLAPCPHEQRCPLVAPDWCHFSIRLPRSREHMRMKGGTLGYEDEKFSYLIVARPDLAAAATAARVIKPPVETKFSVTLPLCTTEGLREPTVLKREGAAFKAARKLEWGDEASEFLPS
jgi:ribosomal protein RSM22 (predicted rRNA methylase)